jgi:hypothetical protein
MQGAPQNDESVLNAQSAGGFGVHPPQGYSLGHLVNFFGLSRIVFVRVRVLLMGVSSVTSWRLVRVLFTFGIFVRGMSIVPFPG